MPIGTWLYATDRQVRDGSGTRWYRSGFHTFASWETCLKYLRRFRRRHDLCIVEVEVGGTVWMKPQSKGQVQLSTQMKILGIKITVPQLDQEGQTE